MGIKLVRKSSDVPNITNSDDAKMIRYAYGGYVGVVKGFGEELSLTIEGSKATIGSGRIVVDGWEIDIDGSGYEVSHSGSSAQYYSVILTINLATETAMFRLVSGAVYPDVSSGDDLTTYPNGSKEIVTHHLRSEGTVFMEGERVVPAIPYLLDVKEEFEQRLAAMGFKEGILERYAILEDGSELAMPYKGEDLLDPPQKIQKTAKNAYFNLYSSYTHSTSISGVEYIRFYFPKGFTPMFGSKTYAKAYNSAFDTDSLYEVSVEYMFLPTGEISAYIDLPRYSNVEYSIQNFGFEIIL